MDNLEFIFNLSNKMSPEIQKILGEIILLDKGTDKFKNVKIQFNDAGVDRFNNKLKAVKGSMQYYKQMLERLEAGRDKAWRTDQIEKYNKMISRVRDNISKVNKLYDNKAASPGAVPGGGGMFSGQIGSMLQAGMLVGGLYKIFDFSKEAALTGAKYEKYEALYRNTFQNREQARFRMDELKSLSALTPFQIGDWIGSDIKLQNRGMNLGTGKLTNLGDLAANQGKGVDQLVEAMLDAGQMEFERLKEFGIKASKEGDKVTLNFKNQAIVVKANAQSISDAIIQMGTWKGVAGSMSAVSKTTEGAISNLSDSYEQMMAAIGQAENGPVRALIDGLSSITNTVRKWFEIPTSQKLMQEQGEMTALVAVAQDYTKTSDERNAALQQLQATYPEYFANLNEEDVKLGKLKEKLDKVNASYDKKIGLASAKEIRQSNLDDLNSLKDERDRLNLVMKAWEELRQGSESAKGHLSQIATGGEVIKMRTMKDHPENYQRYLKDKMADNSEAIAHGEVEEFKNAQNEKLAQLTIFTEKYKNKYDELTDKMNASDKAKFKALYDEYMGALDPRASFGRGRKDKAINDAITAGQKMDEFIKGEKKSENITKATASSSSKSDAIIGGGAKPVNINVNIATLNGVENLTQQGGMKENSNDIGDAVLDVMLRAINGAVLMTGNNVR